MDAAVSPPADLVSTAVEAYNLERLLQDSHEEAIKVAIQAVLESHRAQVISEISDNLGTYADDLYAEEDIDDEIADYVHYCSDLVQSFGTPEVEINKYVPHEEDLIEIIARGMVHRNENGTEWVVSLDRGDLLEFDMRQEETTVRVRLIERESTDD